MFDTHVYRQGDQHHHHRNEVHEHRAPTDESVKLLREMEAKALEQVLSTVRLEGCEVDCAIHYMLSPMLMEHRFVIRYRLGKTERTVRHETHPWTASSNQNERERIARELVQALAEDMAVAMIAPQLAKVMPQLVKL